VEPVCRNRQNWRGCYQFEKDGLTYIKTSMAADCLKVSSVDSSGSMKATIILGISAWVKYWAFVTRYCYVLP